MFGIVSSAVWPFFACNWTSCESTVLCGVPSGPSVLATTSWTACCPELDDAFDPETEIIVTSPTATRAVSARFMTPASSGARREPAGVHSRARLPRYPSPRRERHGAGHRRERSHRAEDQPGRRTPCDSTSGHPHESERHGGEPPEPVRIDDEPERRSVPLDDEPAEREGATDECDQARFD